MTLSIYVIKLTNNKYYVGKTKDVNFRLGQHFDGFGSMWTQKYKPVEVIKIIETNDDFDEDKITLKYMAKYGIDNVRGGSFCKIELDDNDKIVINKMLCGSCDKCYLCGKTGHFAKYCNDRQIDNNNDFEITNNTENNRVMCYRCGRDGHFVFNCYATTHLHGKSLFGCYNCGREDHWAIVCKYETDIYGKKINKSIMRWLF